MSSSSSLLASAVPEGAAAELPSAEITRLRLQRVRHLPWIGASCAIDTGVLVLYSALGTLPAWVPVAFGVSSVLLLLISYLLLRTGFSERFRDPYISAYQLIVTSLCTMVFAALAPAASFHFYNVMLLIFTFATLRLNLRQALVAGAVLSASVGAVMWFHAAQPPLPQTRGEVAVAWLSHLTVLARCLIVGLYGSSLRVRLKKQNERLAESSARIEQLASHDELTGALNRRAVWALLEGHLTPPQAGAGRLCVALLDLDHFKQVNDRFGHPAGDAVLKRFSEVVRQALRDSDRLGRYGGEEFLVLLPRVDPEQALRVVDRLRAAVEATDWSDIAAGLQVTVSAGVAAWQTDDSVALLVSRADEALYRAKHAGRNRVVTA
ncbi:GGDEF domain-containing protein [Ideonella sp. BN130291]|uniref:GGDEF domain-containing protein n=1 Tax=Ideonella sp. BN130291 TaxID=3112940 RepID=UPI002E267733|nr:GGDEF domain-containing protein [Ideonella sp. BN130291]